jgi:hypothetical protein
MIEPATSQRQAMSEAETWVQNLQQIFSARVEDTNENDNICKLFRVSGGHFKVEFLRDITLQNYGQLGNFHRANLRIRTVTADLIDRILVEGNHPCWVMKFRLCDRLDIPAIVSSANYAGRNIPMGRGMNGNKTYYGFDYTFRENTSVYVMFRDAIDGTSEVTLVWNGAKDEGFFKVHRMLRPETILSILYDKRKTQEVRQIINDSCLKPV